MTEETMRDLVKKGRAVWANEEDLTIALRNPGSSTPIIVRIIKNSRKEND